MFDIIQRFVMLIICVVYVNAFTAFSSSERSRISHKSRKKYYDDDNGKGGG